MSKSARPMPSNPCPHCEAPLAWATGFNTAPPAPGDPTLCNECGHLLVFTEDLNLRPISEDDWKTYSPHLRKQLREMEATAKRDARERKP